jgi:predicted RNase H-like HicB family nuclease
MVLLLRKDSTCRFTSKTQAAATGPDNLITTTAGFELVSSSALPFGPLIYNTAVGSVIGRRTLSHVEIGCQELAAFRSEEGFAVTVPGLPGCWSQGSTEEEAAANIQDAIREYLAAVEEQLGDADVREIEVAV